MKYLVLLSIAACASDPDSRPRTFEYVTEAIIVPYCGRSSCHSTTTQIENLTLDTLAGTRAAMKTGRMRVTPGSASSELLQVITSTRKPMPPDVPLPDADLELIRDWIVNTGAEGL